MKDLSVARKLEPAFESAPENPIERLKEVLRDLRGGRDADEALVAICGSLVNGSKDAVATCGAQLSMFPKAHFIGHGKYHMMQERFLQVCEELGLPAKPERHPGTSTSYATVEHPRLRITIAKVRRYDLNPRLHPFRLVTNVKHFVPIRFRCFLRCRSRWANSLSS